MDDGAAGQTQATIPQLTACSRCGLPITDAHFVLSLGDGVCWHTECEVVIAPPRDGTP